MAETVDVQEQAIGAGSILALALVGYGRFIGETILGFDATTLGIGAFAATFAAVGLIHGAYGRRDFAVAHTLAAIGLGLVVLPRNAPATIGGLVLLIGAGVYITRATIRARDEDDRAAVENA